MSLLFHYSWHISAIGEREATICLELSRALWKPQVETWLLFNRHHCSLHAWLTVHESGGALPLPPTFKFGGLQPPLPPLFRRLCPFFNLIHLLLPLLLLLVLVKSFICTLLALHKCLNHALSGLFSTCLLCRLHFVAGSSSVEKCKTMTQFNRILCYCIPPSSLGSLGESSSSLLSSSSTWDIPGSPAAAAAMGDSGTITSPSAQRE